MRAVGRVRVDDAVADVGAKRAQRDAPLLVPLGAAHLGAAEATGDLDLHALGAGLDRALDRLLDRLAERDAPLELTGHVLGQQHAVELGLEDLLDLELDLLVRQLADVGAQRLDVRATLADDDPRLGRVDGDGDVVDATLDLDLADARVRQLARDQLADPHVLLEQRRVVAVGVPLRQPGLDDADPEAVRMDLVTHAQASSRSATATVMWLVRLRTWK